MGKARADKRSCQKKKKVFVGGKPYSRSKEFSQDEVADINDDNLNEPGPLHRINTADTIIPAVATVTTEAEPKQAVVYKKIVNKTKQKLKNSPFICNLGMTRSQKRRLCCTVNTINKTKCVAEGLKLIDMELLQKCLERAVICKNCYSRKVKWSCSHNLSSKKGLTEALILKYNVTMEANS